jgi:Rhodococcus equi virulence-associated protein
MSTVPKPVPIDRKVIAQNFAANIKGKLPQPQIDSITRGLMAETASYSANGSVIGVVFYFRFTVDCQNKHFTGNAGGLGSVGGGALMGDIYTDNLANLFANTVSFSFEGTPVYFSLQFFDSNSNLLGHFQSGAVSIVSGIGGGSGSWS